MTLAHGSEVRTDRTTTSAAAPAARDGLREVQDGLAEDIATGTLSASQLLKLQRASGNRAVSRLVSRRALARQEVTTPSSAYADAMSHSDWDQAVRSLDMMAADERTQTINAATTEQLISLGQAAESNDKSAVYNQIAAVLGQPSRSAEAAQINRDRAFVEAMRGPNWDHVVDALADYDDAGLDAKLATLHLEQLNDLSAAARARGEGRKRVFEHAEAARVRKLGQDWEFAYQHANWERAVTLVQAYNDTDLPGRLGALSYDQIVALEDKAKTMADYSRVANASEPVRVRKLGEEYTAAVNAPNWNRAVLLANAYNDDDLLGRLRQIQSKGAGALSAADAAAVALKWDDNHRVRRGLAFLKLEGQVGPTARPQNPSTFTLGAGGTTVAVPGGTVTEYSSVSNGPTSPGWFAQQYSGTDVQHTGWLQFICREIERFDAAGNSLGFYQPAGGIGSTGQPPTERLAYGTATIHNWRVDTFSNTLPFYDAPVQTPSGGGAPPSWTNPVGTRGGNITVYDTPGAPAHGGTAATPAAPGQTTMVDNPGNLPAHVNQAFAAVPGSGGTSTAVARVEARARFVQYLVRGPSVLLKTGMVATDTFTSAPSAGGTATRTNTPAAPAKVDKLDADHYQALIHRFPDFTYFPH